MSLAHSWVLGGGLAPQWEKEMLPREILSLENVQDLASGTESPLLSNKDICFIYTCVYVCVCIHTNTYNKIRKTKGFPDGSVVKNYLIM